VAWGTSGWSDRTSLDLADTQVRVSPALSALWAEHSETRGQGEFEQKLVEEMWFVD
jgi:hypothetical protein